MKIRVTGKSSTSRIAPIAITALVIVLFPLEIFSQPDLKKFQLMGYAQGTTYHVTYYASEEMLSKIQLDAILNRIDSSMSIYKSYSRITQFNNHKNGVEMDNDLKIVVEKSLEIFRETGGYFDITVYPLVNAWGFGAEPHSKLPDSAEIKMMLTCVGSEKIMIKGDRLVKNLPCVKLDVNGIAQGYSVDVIAEFMEKNGIQNYLVELGGELRVKGRRQPGGELMEIGIEGPSKKPDSEAVIRKVMQLENGALTTSGNYRKFFEKNGKVYSHLMDPNTGFPIQNELISVTVYAKDAITADGYDNALMGMGLMRALAFLKNHPGIEAYFVYQDSKGTISDTATPGFAKFLEK